MPSVPAGARAGPTHDAACPVSDDEGYEIAGARRQRKKEQARARSKPLTGVEKRQAFRLYVTYCHPDAVAEDIESYFIDNFEGVTDAYARKTEMKNHSDYCSFTVVVKGRDLSIEQLTDPDSWPDNVRVYPRESGGGRHV